MQRVHRFTAIIGILLFAAGSAWAVDGQIKIAQTASTIFPIVINKAGSYVLTSNLVVTDPNVNAITIEVNDVTLDLNGHTIQGPNTGGDGNGIYAYNKYSIAIQKGRVWGFGSTGIKLDFESTSHPSFIGAGHRLEGVQVANNYRGILMSGGIVSNCTSNNSSIGFEIDNSTVTNCTANNNFSQVASAYGFYVNNSTMTNCTAIKNYYGFYGSFNTVVNCTANQNTNTGFSLSYSTITNCTASSNGAHGIFAQYDCSVTDCTAHNNFFDGIRGYYRNVIKGCMVSANSQYGIDIPNSNSGCYVYRNAATANTSGQIFCASGNTCVDNAN